MTLQLRDYQTHCGCDHDYSRILASRFGSSRGRYSIPRNYNPISSKTNECIRPEGQKRRPRPYVAQKEDQEKITFTVPTYNNSQPSRRYQWTLLPQGMPNSPTLLQKKQIEL